MMKKLLFVFFILPSSFSFAQYWMQRAGGAGPDEGLSISMDDSNNTYTTGYFSINATFGNTVLSCLGVTDIFLTKNNSNGIFQWAKKAGDGGVDKGLAVKTDANGNSYITGYYFGTAIFGKDTIKSAGLQDIFVAKYDRNGNIKWVVSAGGTQSDIGNAITIDNSGNVIIAGQFTDTAKFGSFTLISVTGFYNVFTAKLDSSNGNFLWAKAGTGNHNDRGLGVACDNNGNVYVTGQFTDTVTFDNTYYTVMYNAIFIVKYDNTGKEVWFTKAGGGIFNIATAIAVDNNSNVFITGNFTGDLFFFTKKVTVLTNIYPNKIFIAKYDQNANLLWDVADGSSNPVNANSISLDGSGNPYIIGNFECIMNGYADKYGQGTFNTVGYWDIYASEYSGTNGTWQWSRQIGGHKNNYGYAIAVSPAAIVFTTGSFDDDMIITWDPNYTGGSFGSICECMNNYHCNDPYYGQFQEMGTHGDLDIFIAKPFDLNRQTYDYYIRGTDSSCNSPYIGVSINNNSLYPCGEGSYDTLQFCIGGTLAANPNAQGGISCYGAGPYFTYLWSNASKAQTTYVSTTREYYVKQTSVDGCFISIDSVYVIIHPKPPQPTISDNVVINTNSTNPLPILLCRDSVTLTGGNYGIDKHAWGWEDTYGIHSSKTDSITLKAPDSTERGCCFSVIDSFGCSNVTCINVVLDSALPPIVLAPLECASCRHDTAFLCTGSNFGLTTYDTLSKNTCIPPSRSTICYWFVTPNTITYSKVTSCPDGNGFSPKDSGWYYIKDSIVRNNYCGHDVHVLKDSIYARLYPVPKDSITLWGNTTVCLGDSTWIFEKTNGTKYYWFNNSTIDSMHVTSGSYEFYSTLTNKYGCSNFNDATITVKTFAEPTISMNPNDGLVCPGDSVEITCSANGGVFQWYGPGGPFGGNTPIVYVKNPGDYLVTQVDTNGCHLVSNTLEVNLYGTPYLFATPNSVICPGDSVTLNLTASPGATINWQYPFSGNSTVQYATKSGTYTCIVTSCNIITQATVAVTFDNPKAIITAFPGTDVCHATDTVILTANDTNVAQWLWEPGYYLNQSDTVAGLGTYTLITIDGYGCIASSSITISLPQPFDDSALSQTNLPCFEDDKGSASLTLKGGIPAYTYSWSNHATAFTISGLSAGIYTVSVHDKCGSSATASLTITQPPNLLALSHQQSDISCYGGSNGSATLTVSGGTPAFSFSWSDGTTTSTITGLSQGVYSVIVTDSNGCTFTTKAIITQPSLLTAISQQLTAISCYGGTNGSATLTVSGGTPAYTYSWSDGATTNSITGLSSGTYTLTVNDSAGCSSTGAVTISQPSAIAPTITPLNATCLDNDGSISVAVAGGTSPYTYQWSNNSKQQTATGLSTGSYTVTISDANGCIDTISGYIGLTGSIKVTIAPIDSVCKGKSAFLSASGATTYQWSDGASSDTTTIVPLSSGNYWVIGKTGLCSDSDTVRVGVYPPIIATSASLDTICYGQPFSLLLAFTGGKPVYTFSWNNGITSDSPGPFLVSPNKSITYIANVTDGCNYFLTDSIRLLVLPAVSSSFIAIPDTIEVGQTVNFMNNSTGANAYIWNFGNGSGSTEFSPSSVYNNTGTYLVLLITDNAFGCPDTAKEDVVVVTKPVIIPNVFTPNGDGIDDIFNFNIEGATCFEAKIYNRWGVLIYESGDSHQGWDGNTRQTGTPASDGVYYYIVDYCQGQDIHHTKDGFIQLLRNK